MDEREYCPCYTYPSDIQERVKNFSGLKPSEIVRTIRKDIEAVERNERFLIEMAVWFETDFNYLPKKEVPDAKCQVCAAGAVMMNTLGIDFTFIPEDEMPNGNFLHGDPEPLHLDELWNHDIATILSAADYIRQMQPSPVYRGVVKLFSHTSGLSYSETKEEAKRLTFLIFGEENLVVEVISTGEECFNFRSLSEAERWPNYDRNPEWFKENLSGIANILEREGY